MTLTYKIAFALTIMLVLLITYGTLRPPGEGGSPLPFTDKQLHFMAFFALVVPLGWVRPNWVVWLVALGIGFGALIEVVQPAFGRSGELADLAADALGVMAGVLPGQLRKRYRSAQKHAN